MPEHILSTNPRVIMLFFMRYVSSTFFYHFNTELKVSMYSGFLGIYKLYVTCRGAAGAGTRCNLATGAPHPSSDFRMTEMEVEGSFLGILSNISLLRSDKQSYFML